ncbi:hypothetical protein HDU67_009645 [Dinochytrium kinnereticum]|nr:hypothetical protein HDU67_009645 [Dinochytrium kinnereticum]
MFEIMDGVANVVLVHDGQGRVMEGQRENFTKPRVREKNAARTEMSKFTHFCLLVRFSIISQFMVFQDLRECTRMSVATMEWRAKEANLIPFRVSVLEKLSFELVQVLVLMVKDAIWKLSVLNLCYSKLDGSNDFNLKADP